jgi:hypothetical protein
MFLHILVCYNVDPDPRNCDLDCATSQWTIVCDFEEYEIALRSFFFSYELNFRTRLELL